MVPAAVATIWSAFTAPAVAELIARRRTAVRSAAPSFAEQHLARQLDAVLIVDGDDLDLHAVADFTDAFHLVDVLVIQLADVAQPVAAWQDLDEGAKILHGRDPPIVNF